MAVEKKPVKNKVVKKSKPKKPSASKTKKPTSVKEKEIKKTKPKKTTGKSRPDSLKKQADMATSSLNKNLVNERTKKKKKPSKKSLERRFWIVVAIAFAIVIGFSVYFVFSDYLEDSSTPAQKSVEELSGANKEYLETLGSDIEVIESIKVVPQGPIIYITYTVPASLPREDAVANVNNIVNTIKVEKGEELSKYSFQFTVVNSGEEAEGVNNYPLMGALNAGRPNVVWMDMGNTYVEPVKETEEVPTETPVEEPAG